MGVLKDTLSSATKELPRIALRKLLTRKVSEADSSIPDDAIDSLVTHILEQRGEEFVWNGDGAEAFRRISLEITAEDEAEIQGSLENAIKAIPNALKEASRVASQRMFERLCDEWPMHRAVERYELDEFRERMEDRWGEGIDYLRMLLVCCREIGSETYRRHRRSKAKTLQYRRWVMVRLHTRSCQIADEIICLMENGFADAAMARWRTLHEISVVAILISDGSEELAERYMLHDAIERKRQADEYEESQVPQGFAPIGKRERKTIDADFIALLARFGPEFAHAYGWAARDLNQRKPAFKDLQKAANRTGLSTHYKVASINVHATSRAMFHSLATMGNESLLLAGRSNMGLVEPGELTAQTLLLTTGLFAGATRDLDRLAELASLVLIRDAVAPALVRAERRIARDERQRQKDAETRRVARAKA